MHSKLMQTIADSHVKATEVIDVSGPICFREFFSAKFVVKLERDYGKRSYVSVHNLWCTYSYSYCLLHGFIKYHNMANWCVIANE
ncbi:MAG: hypothetical protein LBH62_02930 [Nitrososphaerota archaeon]|nr:hypothetical protein [Nitrososphaerota archaeon]